MSEPSAVSADEMNAFFEEAFVHEVRRPLVLRAQRDLVVIRFDIAAQNMRPGGYISGPTQMALADHAAYASVFTRIGITPMALTSNLNINFLRPCQGSWIEATARVMKFGRASVVVEVDLTTDRSSKTASHAIVTYVVPRD